MLRAQMEREHLEYIQGLIQYLATSPRSPASLRTQMLSWGPTRDEWQATGGYSPQIYVREARRMVSDYVMTQADCQSARVAPDSVCLGSYNMDSHNCQRIVKNGFARNEGDVQVALPKPYPISYRSIIPRVDECENVFVTFAISASHIAFGSTRMEPVFMMASQSAATAAAFAIDDNAPVQQVNYAKLALQLTADAQVLIWGGGDQSSSGVIMDTSDPGAAIIGVWSNSPSIAGYWGTNYIHDQNSGKGAKSVRFTPNLPQAGPYHVYLRWTADPNRASNAPVDIVHTAGTNTFLVNQMENHATWVQLLTTNFTAGTNGSLLLRNANTTGYVIADAARWLSASNGLPPVQIIATDPMASETGKSAKLTFIRSAGESSSTITVHYQLGGTASNGVDLVTLPGTLAMPVGVSSTSLVIQALSDAIPEGDKLLTVTLQPNTGYSVGSLRNPVVRILDTPFDGWRFARFTASELTNSIVSGVDADPDHDSASNWQEFLAGSDPCDAASVLRMKIDAVTNEAHVSFSVGSNHTYTLQYRDALAAGGWLDLTNFPPVPTNRTLLYFDPLPDGRTNRIYRVVAQ